jgi:Putative Ig domain
MAAPTWITKAGSLGIAEQLKPFSVDIGVQTGTHRAHFQVISGSLPPGLRLSPQGNISGYPQGQLSGVPLAVNQDEVFTFVVRCTNEIGELADRTFSITVTGEIAPEPRESTYINNSMGAYADGSWIDIDISGYDINPGDTLTYTVVGGALPDGLTLNSSGHITGYVNPQLLQVEVAKFDTDNWDALGWDQSSTLGLKTYYFDVRISDGKIPVVVPYTLTIVESHLATADTTVIDADSTLPTSTVSAHTPVLLERAEDLGTFQDENHFFHRFLAQDFDEDAIGFEVLPIMREPTVVGTVVNPVIVSAGLLGINPTIIYSTLVAHDSVSHDPLLTYTLPVYITSTDSAGVALDGTFATPGVDYTLMGRQVVFSSTAVLSGKTNIDIYQGVIAVSAGPQGADRIAQSINTASASDPQIRNVSASVSHGRIAIFTTDSVLSLSDLTGNTLADLGLSGSVTIRNQQDPDGDVTENPDQLLPAELSLNSNTGWLYGYINALDRGSQTYTFYLRVFKKRTEPSSIVTPVDYALTYPFSVINGRTASELSELGIDAPGSVFNNRTVVFAQQENFAAQYVGLAGSVFHTDPGSIQSDGWYDQTNTVIPGWTEAQANPTVPNRRAGVWRFRLSGSVYYLDFVQEIQQGTLVLADRYTSLLDSNGFTRRGIKLLYQPDTTFTSPQTVPAFTTDGTTNLFSKLWKRRINVTSSSNYLLSWITDSELGTVPSGMPCKQQVQAQIASNETVTYTLLPYNTRTVDGNFQNSTLITLDDVSTVVVGSRVQSAMTGAVVGSPVVLEILPQTRQVKLSSAQTLSTGTLLYFLGTDLPRGLTLTSNGELQGRVSHQHWNLDDNTTFDAGSTTFDREYILNIQATVYLQGAVQRSISTVKSFRLRVVDYKTVPSSNLYLEFLLRPQDRHLLSGVVFNDALIPDEHVYRASDPWWGRQTAYRMLVAYGIDTAQASQVQAAVAAYHHKKVYRFPELKWAQSLNAAGEVEYEVIYMSALDDFTLSTGAQFTGDIPVGNLSLWMTGDETDISVDTDLTDASQQSLLSLKPASLANMQNRIQNTLSISNRHFLPSWMISIQPDGHTPNYTPAVPLVYLRPGTGRLALYKIQQALQTSEIQGLVNRYYWDDGLALNWDKQTQSYYSNQLTTFDALNVGQQFNLLGQVDLAVDLPFHQVHGARSADLRRTGALDGYRGILNGARIIFYRQEQYENLTDFEELDGWARTITSFDNNYGIQYESYEVITGYTELQNLPAAAWSTVGYYNVGDLVSYQGISYRCIRTNGPSTTFNFDWFAPLSSTNVNQRAGIWQIQEDFNGVISLVFDTPVNYSGSAPYDTLNVRTGVLHGGSVVCLVSPLELGSNYTVPGYADQSSLVQSAGRTIFDTSVTQFFDKNTDEFMNPDTGAKYIVFRNQSFIDRGIVDV